MDYYSKYMKYKNKYLKLKKINMIGGGDDKPIDINTPDVTPEHTDVSVEEKKVIDTPDVTPEHTDVTVEEKPLESETDSMVLPDSSEA